MKTPLSTLYTSAHDLKHSDAPFGKTRLLTDKRTFAQAQASADLDYHGCYNGDDDFADYTPTLKAVRIA